jgi:hypothetical protein
MAAKQADESMMVSQSKDQFSTKLKLPGQFAESRYIFLEIAINDCSAST